MPPMEAMSSGGHLRVRPVDPRDTTWEANAPSYRVYFWWRPPGAPPSGQGAMAYVSDEFEVDGADVAAVLAWAEATASPDRTYTLYALVDCDGAAGLVRLAGTNPTAPTRDEG
jgi:hypothetical protein